MPKKSLVNQFEGLFPDAVIPEPKPEPALGESRPPESPMGPSAVEPMVAETPAPEVASAVEAPLEVAAGPEDRLPAAEPKSGSERVSPRAELSESLKGIEKWLAVPVADEELARRGRLLGILTLVVVAVIVAVLLVFVVVGLSSGSWDALFRASAVSLVTLVGVLVGWALVRRGRVMTGIWFFLGVQFLIIALAVAVFDGYQSPAQLSFIVSILVAGMLLGPRAALEYGGLVTLVMLLLLTLEQTGLYKPPFVLPNEQRVSLYFGIGLVMFGAISGLAYLAFHSLEQAHERTKGLVRQLEILRATLEQRVADRTRELNRRATQLQAAAKVSHAASSVLEPEALIRQAVNVIGDRFDYYYVGLFLLDPSGLWAVLKAGSGQAGREMLAQGHKLEVGGNSMIGWCTAHSQARIALDVGEEAIRFDNPLLPETRSEMALPLISRGRVIGALTVQGVEPQAFSDEDISVLQTMSDQVANAIENARLLQETERLARRNQLISEVSGKLHGALDLEGVLQTTVRELGLALGASEAVIRLGTADQARADARPGVSVHVPPPGAPSPARGGEEG